MSDDIWAIQADLQALIARSSGDTRRVLNLAAEALITAGGMEDSKAQRERDGRDACSNLAMLRQWLADHVQFP